MKVNIEFKNKVEINLSKEEALVLFEWLSNFNEKEHPEMFQDQAEERVLFDLEAILERVITVTFESNYIELLNDARQKIRDRE